MNSILDMVDSNKSEFIEKLTEAGFDTDQASSFLPQAAQGINDSINNIGSESIFNAFISGNFSDFLNQIDIEELSSKIGIPQEQALSGINAIMPMLSQFFNNDESGAQLTASKLFNGLSGLMK